MNEKMRGGNKKKKWRKIISHLSYLKLVEMSLIIITVKNQ